MSADGNLAHMKFSTGVSMNSESWAIDGPWGSVVRTWQGDFDGDGRADIATGIDDHVHMKLTRSDGIEMQSWKTREAWGHKNFTWAGDFNGDGRTDIATSDPGDEIRVNMSAGTAFESETSFTMVIMSDPQLLWSCGSDATTVGDYCSDPANRSKEKEFQAFETNLAHIVRIASIQESARNFAGVIVNGDLTSFGDKDDPTISDILGIGGTNWDRFNVLYRKQGFGTVWFGLGNHDYSNNVGDCGAKGTWTWNHCAARMVQHVAEFARSHPSIRNHDVRKYKKNPLQAGDERNLSGSMSYSWDVGQFHFVQLNFHPGYERSFTRGYSSGISSWDIKIKSSYNWLANDLAAAQAEGKQIILNWHSIEDTDRAQLETTIAPYAESIRAIFVGHMHRKYGHRFSLDVQTPGASGSSVSIPVIYGGSALHNRFLRAEFTSDAAGCEAMDVYVVDTWPDANNNYNDDVPTYNWSSPGCGQN